MTQSAASRVPLLLAALGGACLATIGWFVALEAVPRAHAAPAAQGEEEKSEDDEPETPAEAKRRKRIPRPFHDGKYLIVVLKRKNNGAFGNLNGGTAGIVCKFRDAAGNEQDWVVDDFDFRNQRKRLALRLIAESPVADEAKQAVADPEKAGAETTGDILITVDHTMAGDMPEPFPPIAAAEEMILDPCEP